MRGNITLIVFALLLSGCRKYEEGPSFSLRSKKERLANSWGVKQYLLNGTDKTDSFLISNKEYDFSLVRSGTYTMSWLYNGQSVSESGAWKFTDKDMAFEILSGKQFATPQKYFILKLKEKELWCYHEISAGVKEEFHFKPQ